MATVDLLKIPSMRAAMKLGKCPFCAGPLAWWRAEGYILWCLRDGLWRLPFGLQLR